MDYITQDVRVCNGNVPTLVVTKEIKDITIKVEKAFISLSHLVLFNKAKAEICRYFLITFLS